ncbi:MAG: ribonucleoprotein [Thaumarchaeota archaeon]|jgi:small nuclear ribonucleoprotein|nr:MAG: ribonucleoprotein [Nitrososphaerota archaeon]
MADEISTLMKNNRDKVVLLRLRNKTSLQGILKDFDIHMNLTLEDAEDVTESTPKKLGKILLRGDNVLLISLPNDKK